MPTNIQIPKALWISSPTRWPNTRSIAWERRDRPKALEPHNRLDSLKLLDRESVLGPDETRRSAHPSLFAGEALSTAPERLVGMR